MESNAMIRRLSSLGWRKWVLLAETLAMVAISAMAIRMLPFRWVIAIAARPLVGREPCDQDTRLIADLRWAIDALAKRVPWRTVCFQKALALHFLLRRRHLPSLLHYGVRQTAGEGLSGHVWVSVRGASVIGDGVAGEFHCLATFPSEAMCGIGRLSGEPTAMPADPA
jgi:hypothetical protein